MDAKQLYMAINDIDEKLIEGANISMSTQNKTNIKTFSKKTWVKWAAAAACFVVCLGLGAITLNMTGMGSYDMNYATTESATQSPMAAPESMEYAAETEMMIEEATYDMAAKDDAGAIAGNSLTTSGTGKTAQHGLKIVYRYDAQIETRDFDATVELLKTLSEKHGGYIEYSDLSAGTYYGSDVSEQDNYPRYAYYNFRVPVENYDAFIAELTANQNITHSSESADDITSYYIDTEARLEALYDQEQRIIDLAEQTTNINDLLIAEQQLSQVRYEIENFERQKSSMDDQVSFTYISVGIDEITTPSIATGDSFLVVLGDAVMGSLVGVVDFFKNVLIVVIYAVPYLAIAFIGLVIIKKIVKSKKAKHAKQNKED